MNGSHFCIQDVPGLGDLEQLLLAAKSGKAVGPDGLAIEAFRVHPTAAALHLYPLMLKSFLGTREPSEWRGGALMALAKKAATVMECSNFRSIMLASTSGKLYHRLLRGRLSPSLDSFKQGQQAGTSRGVGVDTIALIVRAFQGCATGRSNTTAITFYDVKSAYYRVLRQTILKSPQEDRPLLELWHRTGIPSSAVTELYGHLSKMALLEEAGVSGHLQSAISDLEPEVLLTATRRGSRPGDPLADLLFGFCMTGYLTSVEKTLQERHLSTAIPQTHQDPPWHSWQLPTTVQHASWADDYAHLQQVTSAAGLEEHVRSVAGVHTERATSVGMTLTFAEDKTAAVLPISCQRPGVVDPVLNPEGKPGLIIKDAVAMKEHFMPLVDSYRHLGGIITANSAPHADIAYRFSQASAALRPLRRRLFSEKNIPLTLRRTLLRSLIVSRFVFACAITDLSSAIHKRVWCRHYTDLWAALYRPSKPQDRPHSLEILRHAGATSPLLALAKARAVFLARLLEHGPGALLHLLHVHWRRRPSNSWLQQLIQDIKAVALYVPAAGLLLQNCCPVSALVEVLQQDPGWWISKVRAAIKAYAADLHEWASRRANVGSNPAMPSPVSSETARPFRCRWCSASFVLHKHVALHEARSHGALSPVRHYTPHPYCLGCHKWYHTLERTQYHLKRHKDCLLRCLQVIRPLTQQEVYDNEASEAKQRRAVKQGRWQQYSAAAPPLDFYGPRLPTYAEALEGLEEEDISLARLGSLFFPDPEHVIWIEESLSRESTEGARASAAEFWMQRPIQVSPQNSTAILDAPA